MFVKSAFPKSLLWYPIAIAVAVGFLQQSADSLEEPAVGQIIEKLCPTPKPATAALDLIRIELKPTPASGTITADTISQNGLTVPSLWWADEQFGGKLLDNWVAYPATAETPARVDLIVNRQFWSLLTYMERYRFVNQFGIVARDYGYDVRVFNRQGTFLAAYTCAGSSDSAACSVCLDAATRSRGVRGQ